MTAATSLLPMLAGGEGLALSFDEAATPPEDDAWLGPDERRRLSAMRFEKRRRDFRAGRWVLDRLLARWLLGASCPSAATLARIDVRAGPTGVPEATVDGRCVPCRVSLSHREGAVLAAVSRLDALVGVDLEHDEPRSPGFADEWLAPEERATLGELRDPEWSRAVNTFWTAKEAALKALGAGLRRDPRHVVTRFSGGAPAGGAFVVFLDERTRLSGQAGRQGCWLASVVHEPRLRRRVAVDG